MAREQTSLVLGRGEVWFNAFVPGTRAGMGESYLGNTTTFQIGRKIQRLDRFNSYRGQTVEIEGHLIGEKHNITFITDNIEMENVGHWYGGGAQQEVILAQNVVTETLQVAPGTVIQLGQTIVPFGVRSLTELTAVKDDLTIPALGNFIVDFELGRIEILREADAIERGDLLTFSFQWRTTKLAIASSAAKETFGSMRFIANNAYGRNKNYFFPYVRLAARGQVDLKGDDWQQIPFEATALRLNAFTEQVYVEEIIEVSYTADERAILDRSGVDLQAFPRWEDHLDVIINTTMPDRGYPL